MTSVDLDFGMVVWRQPQIYYTLGDPTSKSGGTETYLFGFSGGGGGVLYK